MSTPPQSGGIGEVVGAILGMWLGFAISIVAIRFCSDLGEVARVLSVVLSIILFFVLMIGGSILGGSNRFRA